MANNCNTFPSHNPSMWKYLKALGNGALAQEDLVQLDLDTRKQKRMINDGSISEVEKLESMIEEIANNKVFQIINSSSSSNIIRRELTKRGYFEKEHKNVAKSKFNSLAHKSLL